MASGETLSDSEVLDVVVESDADVILDGLPDVSPDRFTANLRGARGAYLTVRWTHIAEALTNLAVAVKALEARVTALEEA